MRGQTLQQSRKLFASAGRDWPSGSAAVDSIADAHQQRTWGSHHHEGVIQQPITVCIDSSRTTTNGCSMLQHVAASNWIGDDRRSHPSQTTIMLHHVALKQRQAHGKEQHEAGASRHIVPGIRLDVKSLRSMAFLAECGCHPLAGRVHIEAFQLTLPLQGTE